MSTDLLVHLSDADAYEYELAGPDEREVILLAIAGEQAFAFAEREIARSRRRNDIIQADNIA